MNWKIEEARQKFLELISAAFASDSNCPLFSDLLFSSVSFSTIFSF